MGISADLIKFKNSGDFEQYRDELMKTGDTQVQCKELMYIGGGEIANKNTLKDYDKNEGMFTLFDAVNDELINDKAIEKIRDFLESEYSSNLEYAVNDDTIAITLNY